jgi:hypothetical protein
MKTFLDCPEPMRGPGGTRCGLPAEVEYRYTLGSTGGPLDSAKIRCPRGHWFNGPVESLTRGQSGQRAGRSGPAKPVTRLHQPVPRRGVSPGSAVASTSNVT